MNPSYYLFQKLPDEVRAANGIKSANRYDCTKFHSPDEVHPLSPSIKKNGMLFLYLSGTEGIVNTHWRRKAETILTDGKNNISSLYFEDLEHPAFAYGYPNPKAVLSNKAENPYYPLRNYGYLFRFSPDFNELEMLVFPGIRHQIKGFFNLLLDGELDEQFELLKKEAQGLFPYNKLPNKTVSVT